ncbi:hypothetical protein [Asaia krungthepensis]|uniref:Uncharacterized protein n=1 Tax=Asaia krungthepensis NRIC 0535 TaxID=1307925 RepID=A0ABQ0Q302_9PROT|nr:hypothetical protein [Asaia krungthepensis]GBQ88944.1 hypothetical protein AA0535_1670 [Asaia krungthepensis NRIC 0535]
MIEWMDRDYQRKLLTEMAAAYTNSIKFSSGGEDGLDTLFLHRNVSYLIDSGLCTSANDGGFNISNRKHFYDLKITTRGLDFLQDDGGLSAIQNVVTVRFEADTLRALIAAKIDASSEPEEKKAEAKKRLLGLKEEGLKAAVGKVVELGLGNIPAVASWFLSFN